MALGSTKQVFEAKVGRLISSGERRKASNLIDKYLNEGGIITDTAILRFILDPSGMTVAHKMAQLGHTFTDKDILCLCGEDRSRLNAVLGHNGCSVAYILARKGHMFDDPEIQKLGSEKGNTSVAHAMAFHGYKFVELDILKLADSKGVTVAHAMASHGHTFENSEILALTNQFGFSVAAIQSQRQSALVQ